MTYTFPPHRGGGSHNGEGVGGGGGGGGSTGGGRGGKGPDEEELGAFWELLDTEIRPVKPLPACPESQKIFNEHKESSEESSAWLVKERGSERDRVE
ncbi:hypothetical protein E2C01_032225 [Portunus trituberculatus]|uniref:Uncharacterized protein n=1 Tax=Portunus trituberculatus TaxID=210409 RepID=A0A5B7F0S8_PORTR|nr:hypothetical protein [Portunus trituberculatus]